MMIATPDKMRVTQTSTSLLFEVMNTPQPNTISIDGVEITTLSYVFNLCTDAIEKIEKLQVASIVACVWATFATVSIIALAVAR